MNFYYIKLNWTLKSSNHLSHLSKSKGELESINIKIVEKLINFAINQKLNFSSDG